MWGSELSCCHGPRSYHGLCSHVEGGLLAVVTEVVFSTVAVVVSSLLGIVSTVVQVSHELHE